MQFLIILHFGFVNSQYLLHFDFKKNYENKANNLNVGSTGALMLTPLLVDPNRNLEAIQNQALIVDPIFKNTPSYSGFFTVNETYNSNMFFMYVKAKNDAPNRPLVLWLNGGPGLSSLHGFFLENGPFKIVNSQLEMNEYSWHQNAHMLFIDNPVGTGFSFTTDKRGYSTDQSSIAENLYSVLSQFFELFPNLKARKFYMSGQSYAAKYVVSLGHLIHQRNKRYPISHINFNGIMAGNGFWDPYNQIIFSEFYYQLGLADNIFKRKLQVIEFLTRESILVKNFTRALGVFQIGVDSLLNETGFPWYFNFIDTNHYRGGLIVGSFVQQDRWINALHVGNVPFTNDNTVLYFLLNDFMDTVAPSMYQLIQNNYRVLFYNGQLDLSVPYVSTIYAIRKLYFDDWFRYTYHTKRKVWRVGGEVAGFTKTGEFIFDLYLNWEFILNFSISAGVLTEVLVRNCGHLTIIDKPGWIYDLFVKFIGNLNYE